MDRKVTPPSPSELDNPYRPLFGKARSFAELAQKRVLPGTEEKSPPATPPNGSKKD